MSLGCSFHSFILCHAEAHRESAMRLNPRHGDTPASLKCLRLNVVETEASTFNNTWDLCHVSSVNFASKFNRANQQQKKMIYDVPNYLGECCSSLHAHLMI